jgi:dTDP-D-glucose 4,6-dehydratase
LIQVTDDRLAKDLKYLMDDSKAYKELAWKPKVVLHDGLNQTIDWVKHNLTAITQQTMNYQHKV